ncbi:hypothetical protein SeMB42_g00627 [Synchytrium endobioticum]|uniref:Uncharacterized protein n=1 Tax=Synchytrium endobioticum TaxID=286115 RepID=A0A507DPR9_9FUNG|nr:hypothetical protein SeLEV6574_g07966 [Synchytrium endobioticum]TPX53664.1 hypothetical protein SeMB42_g00627 [Synchytrium endobioticum]
MLDYENTAIGPLPTNSNATLTPMLTLTILMLTGHNCQWPRFLGASHAKSTLSLGSLVWGALPKTDRSAHHTIVKASSPPPGTSGSEGQGLGLHSDIY